MNAHLLHLAHYWFTPLPTESHHLFGAGFLAVGVLLVIECVAGGVWFRSRIRAAIWPAGAMFMGEGLIIVAFLDPQDRLIHLTVGVLVLAAGWVELRYRFGQVSRFSADIFVVPALLGSGFEMGVIHGKGDTFTAVGHGVMGMTAAMMAFARVYQGKQPTSFARTVMTGVLVITLALILLIFQP
jgi:hypothetical protein